MKDDVATLDADLLGRRIDAEGLDAAHAGRAHSARDHGGMARLSAMAGQDALRGDHALEVVRVRLPAHKDDLAPLGRAGDGVIGAEDDLADGRPGARVQAAREHIIFSGGVELGMQELVELLGVDAANGFLAGDQALGLHIYRDLERGRGGTLAHAGLEHPEPSLLYGELDVAHVAVMVLKDSEHALERGPGLLEARLRLQVRDGLGVADARHHVLALRVDQEVAVELMRPVSGVAGERDARGGGVALVSEHHDLNVDSRAEVVRNAVLPAVQAGALVHPAAEYGLDGETELKRGVAREADGAVDDELGVGLGVDAISEDALEFIDELAQVGCGEVGVAAHARDDLLGGDGVLEQVGIDAEHDVGEHLDESAVGVPREAVVARLGDEALDGLVVEAEVQDGVHHAGHGERGAGAHRDQKRIARVSEPLAHAALEVGLGRGDLVENPLGPHVAGTRVLDARLAGDSETRRHGQPDAGHLGKVRALAAQDVIHARRTFGHIGSVLVCTEPIHALNAHDTPPSASHRMRITIFRSGMRRFRTRGILRV